MQDETSRKDVRLRDDPATADNVLTMLSGSTSRRMTDDTGTTQTQTDSHTETHTQRHIQINRHRQRDTQSETYTNR